MLVRLVLWVILGYVVWRWLQKLMHAQPSAAPRVEAARAAAMPAAHGARPPHEVLGVSASATPAEVRAAYQKLMLANHPDRLADLDPALRALAEQRTKAINAAYAQLKKGEA